MQTSVPQEKLPASRRRARNLRFPPRERMVDTFFSPILVMAAGRPISNLRLLRNTARRPPVARRFSLPVRVIPC